MGVVVDRKSYYTIEDLISTIAVLPTYIWKF